jgi:hypothetical protein
MNIAEISAQFAHFFVAAYLVSQCGRWGGRGLATGAILMFMWATAKEGWWDEKYQAPDVRGSGWRDWAFYVLGTLVGVLTARLC